MTTPDHDDVVPSRPVKKKKFFRVSMRGQPLDDDSFYSRNLFILIFVSIFVESIAVLLVSWSFSSGLVLLLLIPVFDSFVSAILANSWLNSKVLIGSRIVRFLHLALFVYFMYANFTFADAQKEYVVTCLPELRPIVFSPYLDSCLLIAVTWICIQLELNYRATAVTQNKRTRRNFMKAKQEISLNLSV